MLSVIFLSVIMPSVVILNFATLRIDMLNVIILSVTILRVTVLIPIILVAVAPGRVLFYKFSQRSNIFLSLISYRVAQFHTLSPKSNICYKE
jgi:hypothetical protein